MEIERRSDDEIFSPNGSETTESVAYRVLTCAATLREVHATDLPPLARTIDPDALDALFPPDSEGRCTLTLEFAGTHVTVCQNGDIRAYRLPDRV